MIEVVNCYYIYTMSNDLIMNMNSKNQDHYGGDHNKRFQQSHYGGDYNKEISRATMVENITIDSTRPTMEEI